MWRTFCICLLCPAFTDGDPQAEIQRMEEKEITPSNEGFQFRMGLNDNKAGMEGLDKEKINKIIMEATKVSEYACCELS